MLALAGLIDLGFAAFHLAFWRLFRWPGTLWASGAVNAGVTQTLNAMLTFVFLAYGGTLLTAAAQGTDAPPAALQAGAAFWTLRLVLQWVYFPPRHPASLALAALFALAASAHGLALLSGQK